MKWTKYRRTNIAEMTPWTPDVDMRGVSISDADLASGSPKNGDMIARNPKSHADKWLIAADYFRDNFQPVSATETKLYAITEAEVGTLLALIERLDPRDEVTADEWRMLRSLPELPAVETKGCDHDWWLVCGKCDAYTAPAPVEAGHQYIDDATIKDAYDYIMGRLAVTHDEQERDHIENILMRMAHPNAPASVEAETCEWTDMRKYNLYRPGCTHTVNPGLCEYLTPAMTRDGKKCCPYCGKPLTIKSGDRNG